MIVCSALMTILTISTQDATPVLPISNTDLPAHINITTSARPMPLITLFTTFKYNAENTIAFKNTIRNWALLAPVVRPLLYHSGGNTLISQFAREHNWSLNVYPRVGKSGVPILRSMFHHAQRAFISKTLFFGYANSDILFDHNLLITLKALKRELERKRLKRIFVIGRRTNYKFQRDQQVFNLTSVSQLARAGVLFHDYAQDYFITTRSAFDWDSIPDFVVGRVGYDNWLVATAFKRNMSVIDVTATVTALHQTGAGGTRASWLLDNNGLYENYRIIGKFDFTAGSTERSQFITRWKNSRVIVLKRPPPAKEAQFSWSTISLIFTVNMCFCMTMYVTFRSCIHSVC